jgi:hypothetical protein
MATLVENVSPVHLTHPSWDPGICLLLCNLPWERRNWPIRWPPSHVNGRGPSCMVPIVVRQKLVWHCGTTHHAGFRCQSRGTSKIFAKFSPYKIFIRSEPFTSRTCSSRLFPVELAVAGRRKFSRLNGCVLILIIRVLRLLRILIHPILALPIPQRGKCLVKPC